jgi:NADP-dependent 3-hydroxy acid dehydrogenase YdfG
VILGARRTDRIETIAGEIDGVAHVLDVTDQASVDTFAQAAGEVSVLVNNAGGAKGLDAVEHASDDEWRWMWETNVLGLVRVTRALLPALERSGDGHIVNIGSTAGLEAYPGGAGYTSAKHGVRVITQTLRLELLGRPIRITEVDPGLVAGTEFSAVRFAGDEARAEKVYEGIDALTPEDVAEIVAFAVTRPARVNLDQIVVRPREQATATKTHRRG